MTFEYMLNERERKGLELGLEQGREQGRAEGEASGLAKGASQKQREIAKNFKDSGVPLDLIAKNTGLSVEEIKTL